MSVGILILSLIAACGAAVASVVLGYGLWAALGFYMLGGFFGFLSTLLIVLMRQEQQSEPQLVQTRA